MLSPRDGGSSLKSKFSFNAISTLIFLLFLSFFGNSFELDEKYQQDEQFSHLLNHIATSTRRVHLISELVRNGHRLQVEEFVDLNSWSQLLQFKWHETSPGNGSQAKLTAKKINVIVLNDHERKILVRYEPFECTIDIRNSTISGGVAATNWQDLLADDQLLLNNASSLARRVHLQTVETILSTAPNSPYLARIPDNSGDYWLFGVVGIWMKAQFPGFPEAKQPKQMNYYENGKKVKCSASWRLDLKNVDKFVNYYFDNTLLDCSGANNTDQLPSGSAFNSINLIELRDSTNKKEIDVINVAEVDYKFDDRLSNDLFKLPIGFDCPENPTLSRNGLKFESKQEVGSRMLDLEIVSTKFRHLLDPEKFVHSATDVKTVSMATSKHPLNSAALLEMVQIHEDGFKTVRDFHSSLRYKMHFNGSDHSCEINKLHLYDFNGKQAIDPIEVKFNNGITLKLNERLLDFLFDSEKSESGNVMRLLNHVNISPLLEEFIFESPIEETNSDIVSVTDSSGKHSLVKCSIVRVFQRKISLGNENYNAKRRREALKISRIALLLFDNTRWQKVGELRINIIGRLEPLSFSRRARLFDLSRCSNLLGDSMQLFVNYKAEPRLADYVERRANEFIDEFYKSSIDWREKSNDNNNNNNKELMRNEKIRLGMSLNFLRIPRAEVRTSSQDGSLELRIVVLEKVSPLFSFDQLDESSFELGPLDEQLLVNSIEHCARLCLQFKCRQFAYGKVSHDCKLSPISLDDDEQSRSRGEKMADDYDSDEFDNSIAEEAEGAPQSTKVYRHINSKVYFVSNRVGKVDSLASIEEASLADLYSYLEHSVGELELWNSSEGSNSSAADSLTSPDQKDSMMNSVRLNDWPLLSFKFFDRSNSKLLFAPPERLLLVPSGIKFKVPVSFEGSLGHQAARVARAFSGILPSRAYYLNSLDDWDLMPSKLLASNERTFINRANSTYYNLKRLHGVRDLESCSLMCYNINERDSKTGGGHTCVSLSYCTFVRQCVLVTRTDFSFTSSILDLVQEGELVHELSSLNQLIKEETGCLVAERSNIANFNGPLRLLPAKPYNYPPMSGVADNYYWLPVFSEESTLPLEDVREECAKQCLARQNNAELCFAFDYCTNRTPSYGGNYHSPSVYLGRSCNLMLITKVEPNAWNWTRKLETIRGDLMRVRSVEPVAKNGTTATCDRYLSSHLSEFNYLKHGQVLPHFKQSNQLLFRSSTMESCASECAIRSLDCLAFEYCSNSRDCNLYGRQKRPANATKVEITTTSYSSDCHVYLRSGISSLAELINSDERQAQDRGLAKYKSLIIWFCIIYIFAAICLLLAAVQPHWLGEIWNSILRSLRGVYAKVRP